MTVCSAALRFAMDVRTVQSGTANLFECYTNSKSKRCLCWRRCRLPQRMYNTPAEPPPCRLDIIFDFEMVLMVFKTYLQK